ncbi:MAG: hypothetical protein J6K41_04435 [Paraprevotella sp.]|nr:hypothetical protein [Paraprevotella sp.]
MKRFSFMAAALTAGLLLGTGELSAAQDSTKTTVPATKAQTKTKTVKKKTASATITVTAIDTADAGIIAFSDTSDFAEHDTLASTTISLNQPASIPLDTEKMSDMLDSYLEGAVFIILVFLSLLLLPILLLVYLIYRTRKKGQQTQAATAPQPRYVNTPAGSTPVTGGSGTSPETGIPPVCPPQTLTSTSPSFLNGLIFDQTIMASGIKYATSGAGLFIASLAIHYSRFFIWCGIICFFVGVGKILISLLPTLQQKCNAQPQATVTKPAAPEEKKEESTAEAPTDVPTPHEEKAEDYMPGNKKEEPTPEA